MLLLPRNNPKEVEEDGKKDKFNKVFALNQPI